MMCPSPTPLLCRLALAGTLLAVLVMPARAQTAESHFHTAANQYIGGDNAAALASVNAGLRLAPQDARLNRLKAEIEKQQEQQQNQQNQQQQDQENQQGDQQEQQNQQGEGEGEQGQNQPQQEDPGEQGQDEQQPQQQGDQPNPEPGEEREQQGRPQPDPSKLSPAEAERILQALGNEEETLLRRVAKPQTRARRVEKDW